MSHDIVGRVVVIASLMFLTACGPSAEQLAFEKRVAELEGELEAATASANESDSQLTVLKDELQTVAAELAAANTKNSELEAIAAEHEQRVTTLSQDNETLRTGTSDSQSAIESMRVAKNRLGARLALVQAELWALEKELALEQTLRSRLGALFAEKTITHDRVGAELALEKHLRSRLGAAHASAVSNGHQTDRALAEERHLRSRLGAAHASAVSNGHQIDRALAEEQHLRSRLGAMHASLRRAHWGLDDRHQTLLVLRSRLGAGLARSHEQTRDLELALSETQASALQLATTNADLQASLKMATNDNDRRWQNFATQLKSLANSLEHSQQP